MRLPFLGSATVPYSPVKFKFGVRREIFSFVVTYFFCEMRVLKGLNQSQDERILEWLKKRIES